MIDFSEKYREYPAVFQLTRAALFQEPLRAEAFTETDFTEVFRIALTQALVTEFEDLLPELPVPEDLLGRWEKLILREVRIYMNTVREEGRITAFLKEAGVTPVLLKGSAASLYYPKPEYRMYGDIDFIVSAEDFGKAETLLTALGYDCTEDADARHVRYEKGDFIIELHRYFSNPDLTGEYAEAVDCIIADGMRRAVSFTADGEMLWRLPDAENGLVLLEHLRQHFLTGVGFRQLTDWMMFVKNVLTDEVWEKTFKAYAERTGLLRFALVMTGICERYFGLPKTGRSWSSETDEALMDEALLQMMETGNMCMGRSFAERKTIVALNDKRNIFVRLQTSGLANWKAAKKHKILRPFAWAYQAGRYVNQGLFKRKNALKEIREDKKIAEREALLFKKLGI